MFEYAESDETFSNSTTQNSSSMSSESCCPSFTRLSFETPTICRSPENGMLKPHRSSDSSMQAIKSATFKRKNTGGGLGLRDFSLVRQIGSGDIGKVYLCRLRSDERCYYAMKVVNKDVLAAKNKLKRAQTERKILKMLDHPFLPTLHAEFEASCFSCVVMEFCPGGDLHSLRHKQPNKRFSINSARFYAAEVLVALEYLHMLGIIYRDLKPENVLVRSDGHIMLTDFDLSLCSNPILTVESPLMSPVSSSSPSMSSHAKSSAPFSCLSTRFFRSKKIQTTSSTRLFVAEPVTARSSSFVGTHEYVAPEVASGGDHGSAVDWWALGIFIYEMIYGRTPFASDSNEAILRGIVKAPLTFPNEVMLSRSEVHARDLISGLLDKDPGNRVGAKRGAGEVKAHPFFKGMNFALIRTVAPPEVPGINRKNGAAGGDKSVRQTTPFDFF